MIGHVFDSCLKLVLVSSKALLARHYEKVVKSRSQDVIQEVLDLVKTMRVRSVDTFGEHVQKI